MKTTIGPALIGPGALPDAFPPDSSALKEPNGLLAIGGDLAPERLLAAYRRGIFPWYETGQPILWWNPDPRLILNPRELHISRSLRRTLDSDSFQVTVDTAFGRVMRACAAPRKTGDGTWITTDMLEAYATLHARGCAHSVEVWRAGELVGGLYGVAIGAAFFGESMFSLANDASKVALTRLCRLLAPEPTSLVDCQLPSAHLLGLGARLLSREAFLCRLAPALAVPDPWPGFVQTR